MGMVYSGMQGIWGEFLVFGEVVLEDWGRCRERERMDGGVEWSGFFCSGAVDFFKKVMELIWFVYMGSKMAR